MVALVRIATRKGGKTTARERTIIIQVVKTYSDLLNEMSIHKIIPVVICDEWTWLKHLKMNPKAIAHFNYSNQIFLRLNTFGREIKKESSLRLLLKHELIHAKLKGKEKESDEHSPEFRKLASKYNVPEKWVKR